MLKKLHLNLENEEKFNMNYAHGFSGYLAFLEVDCRIAGFSLMTPRALLRGETSSMHIFLTFPRVPFGRKMDSKLLLR